jgi:hypothetical protein
MTLAELKTLLALNGQQRIPYAEEEIFSTDELYEFYLESISSKHIWFEDYIKDGMAGLSWIAYSYAHEVIKGRWLAAERIILTEKDFTFYYATDVIKGRWPEGEAILSKHAKEAYYYARDIISGRWPEAEAVIATDSDAAYEYAYHVIRGRFLEAEATIASDKFYSRWYNEDFGTNL